MSKDNHLGNVRVVISDEKLLAQTIGVGDTTLIDAGDYFTPKVVSFSDYYPFGSPLRKYNFTDMNVGFNSKRMDNDMGNAAGAVYDYGFRIYDARIGKFTSVDPLTRSYPWYTPYQYAGNNPIKFIDLDGLEEAEKPIDKGETKIKTSDDLSLKQQLASSIYAFLSWAGEGDVDEGAKRINNQFELLLNAIALKDIALAAGESAAARSSKSYDFKLSKSKLTKALSDNPEMLESFTISLSNSRKATAASFFNKLGGKFADYEYSLSHLKAIDYTKNVTPMVLKKGALVKQWVNKKTGKIGSYFTKSTNTEKNVGLTDYDKRELRTFRLIEDVEVLKTTAADYKGGTGGGTQYYSPNLSKNVEPVTTP